MHHQCLTILKRRFSIKKKIARPPPFYIRELIRERKLCEETKKNDKIAITVVSIYAMMVMSIVYIVGK